MVDSKAKLEALRAAYGDVPKKAGTGGQKKSSQQPTDTKEKYEALLAVYGNDLKPRTESRTTGSMNDQIVMGARQALQKHQSENLQKWNGWQKDAAAKAAAQPPKTGAVTLREPVILPSAREEAPSLAQLAEQAQRAYDDYLASDEYKAGQLKNQAARGAAMMQGTGIHTSPIVGAGTVQTDMKEVELRAIRDYYKNQYEAEQSRQIMEADLAELETWTEEDRAALETYVNFRQNSVTSGGYAVPAQRAYNMLTAKYGKNKVNEIAYSWQRKQNEETTKALKESSAEAVKGKTGTSVLHSAATVPANLLGSVTGVYGTLTDLATRDKRYKTLDPNNAGNLPAVYSGAVRGQVAENISGDQYDEQGNQIKDGGGLRQVASYAYQGLMSSADSLARAAVGSGSKAISLGLAATGSFGQTVSDASQRGATPAQAVLLGVVNGGLEVATEYLPLDEILKVAKGGPVPAKQLFKNIFKQAAIEVTEEEASFLGSVMAESIILQEKSGYRQQIAQAIANGASYEDAMKQANVDAIMEAVETAITSAFSGGFSAGVSSGAANVKNIFQNGAERVKTTENSAFNEQVVENQPEPQAMTKELSDEKEQPVAEELPTQAADNVRISDSGTAMLASPVGVENTREQFAEAKRVAAQYGVDIYLYTEYDANRESYVEDGDIYINTESKTPFESIVQGYVQGQYQTVQAQAEATAPAVIQDNQNVIEEAQSVAQQGQNVTAAPLSVAAQIRQNQNLNGGITNETDATDTAATVTGAGVLHGSSQRNDGPRAGEQTGSMAGSSGPAAQRQTVVDQRRATIDRRNRIGALRLSKISSVELGISSGTDARNVQLVPQEHWDAEMGQLAERIYQETGKRVSYVMGKIQIRGKDGRVRNVKGVITGDDIIVQADNLRFTIEQIADHEAYHGRVSYFGDRLNQEIWQHILQKFSAEEFQNVVTKYVEAMQGIYSAEELQSGEAFEQLMHQIQEEIFADAYAGINAFGAGADRFTSAVNEKMEQLGLGRYRSEENGVRETAGPPNNMTGQKENTADYGGAKYSVEDYAEYDEPITTADVEILRNIGKKSINDFTSEDLHKAQKWAYKYYQLFKTKSPFFRSWFGDWRANDTSNINYVEAKEGQKLINGRETNADTGMVLSWNAHDFSRETVIHAARDKVSLEAMDHLPEIIRKAILLDTRVSMPTSKSKMQNTAFMHSFYAVYANSNGTYLLKLYAEEALNNKGTNSFTRAYQLKDIKNIAALGYGVLGENAPLSGANTATIDTVADLFAAVKQYDPEFNPKDSSNVLNADGTPKVVYHGSYKNFSAFDETVIKHSDSPKGAHFFTDDVAVGYSYTGYKQIAKPGGHAYQGGIYPVYLNIRNPYYVDFGGYNWSEKVNGMDVNEHAQYAKDHGYDGLIAYNIVDEGGMGDQNWNEDAPRKPVTDYVVFDPTQIKSATDNIGTFDSTNPDIRYSVDDEADETDYASVQAAMNAQSKEWNEMYLRDKLGDEGYEKYREWEKTQKNQQKQQSRERDKQRNAEKQAARISVTKPVAESRPIEAKRELRSTLMDLFSIPAGSRGAMGNMIDSFADRLIKNGTLTEDDRRRFFDRMYDEGVMTVSEDDYFSEGRSLLTGGRVYVPESVKADFGDDWGDFRRRAFGARIYFTSDRSAAGIDSWNHELASELPGMFDKNETDMRAILERIVDVAEEGRDEKMSLADYTAMLADRGDISEEEFLNDMERKMDEALRTFAKQAKLEVKLRNRTGIQIAKEREAHREMSQRQRDRAELRELQQRTLKTLQWLNKNRNRAPEELQAAFDEVLSDIDIYAVGAANEMNWSDRYNATWKDLAQMYKDASKNDPNFLPSKELEMIVGRLDGTKIADMDLGALNDLYKAAVGLRTEFYNRNNVINDEMQRLFEEVYSDAKREINSAPGEYTGKKMDKLLNLEQLTPMNVLQRMGGWDPNGTFYSIAKQLEKGERDMRAYSVKAKRMLQDFLTEHEDWVKKADGQGKDGIWYEVEIPQLLALEVGKKPVFGATVKVSMTPAQKVHMYLESKNVDNLRHMTGGRTFADKELYSEGKRQEALAQGRTIRMAPETVKAIVSDLTAEEMELARLLEQYYNSFATKEINRVSNILYGYDKAMGKNYAPIYTNRNYTKAEFGVFDSTAEGVGNLKGRQYAVNPSYNISAFDAFEKHVDQTARFVGMAIPARNWTTLMNWRESNNSTADVITHKWGEEGKRYITDLITTLQAGEDVKSDPISSMANKLQSTYITAIFGANPSIVLKQLGSIPLASAYLDAKNVPKPAQIKNIDRDLISKYTQDLEWRTMGYSMPETKQLKENPNWTQINKFYNFTFGGGAITAMDGWAASVLWPWAENKARSDFPELEMGTQEQIQNGESPFYKKVAELFEDAVARSQSTSDEIHQSSIRKSKNPIAKAFTMFRSDSAQTYNTLRQKIGEAQYFARTGAEEPVQEATKKAVGAAFVSMLLNAMWSEGINFLMALWKNKGKHYRDEEEELTFQSVAGEMVTGILGSFAGIVTGGEEIFEVIGNVLTGEKIYDIETPGMEQLNDVVAAITAAGGGMHEIIAGAAKVAVNGGDMGKYFKENGRDMLGCIKDLAETVVMYMPGLPMSGMSVSNVEAYLMGAVKWISPELGAAYDDLWQSIDKDDLTGLTGGALEGRLGRILKDRSISEDDDTVEALAALYEAGHKNAVPGKIPTSVTVNGETQKLDAALQNQYSEAWSGIVAGTLDELIASDDFRNAEPEVQAKMISYLYDYAGEMTKAELFEDYEADARANRYIEMINGGVDEDLANEVQIEMYKLDAADADDVEYWRLIVDSSDSEFKQMSMLGTRMSDATFEKLTRAQKLDVSPDMFVTYYETRSKYDADGNKSYSNAEVKAVIDAMGKKYTNEQKGVLWQMATGSTSTKNNPYSKEAGQKWINAKNADKKKG